MTVQDDIDAYIDRQPEPKRTDLRTLHDVIARLMPASQRWFMDGVDSSGKTVTNPNIGFGSYLTPLAGGASREFYQIGISANTGGISVYVMGIADRTFLPEKYSASIGKASVTGYCIKFRALKDIDIAVLEAAIRDGLAATAA